MATDLATTGADDDGCFEALANESRRRALGVLADHEAPMTLTELAAELVESERRGADLGAGPQRVEQAKIDLYHRHVPKLAESGFVDFDAERRTVALAGDVDDASDTSELLAA